MHFITLAIALCLVSIMPNQGHADVGAAVTPLDNWGRHSTHLDLIIRDNQNDPVYVPTATLLFQVRGYESDDVALVQYYRGKKKVGPEVKCRAAHAHAVKGTETEVVRFERCAPDISKVGTRKAGAWRVEVGYHQLARVLLRAWSSRRVSKRQPWGLPMRVDASRCRRPQVPLHHRRWQASSTPLPRG